MNHRSRSLELIEPCFHFVDLIHIAREENPAKRVRIRKSNVTSNSHALSARLVIASASTELQRERSLQVVGLPVNEKVKQADPQMMIRVRGLARLLSHLGQNLHNRFLPLKFL